MKRRKESLLSSRFLRCFLLLLPSPLLLPIRERCQLRQGFLQGHARSSRRRRRRLLGLFCSSLFLPGCPARRRVREEQKRRRRRGRGRRGRVGRRFLCRRFHRRRGWSIIPPLLAPALDVPLVERRSYQAVSRVHRRAVRAKVGLQLGGGVCGRAHRVIKFFFSSSLCFFLRFRSLTRSSFFNSLPSSSLRLLSSSPPRSSIALAGCSSLEA